MRAILRNFIDWVSNWKNYKSKGTSKSLLTHPETVHSQAMAGWEYWLSQATEILSPSILNSSCPASFDSRHSSVSREEVSSVSSNKRKDALAVNISSFSHLSPPLLLFTPPFLLLSYPLSTTTNHRHGHQVSSTLTHCYNNNIFLN